MSMPVQQSHDCLNIVKDVKKKGAWPLLRASRLVLPLQQPLLRQLVLLQPHHLLHVHAGSSF